MLTLQKVTIYACLASGFENNLTGIFRAIFHIIFTLFYRIRPSFEKILNESDGF